MQARAGADFEAAFTLRLAVQNRIAGNIAREREPITSAVETCPKHARPQGFVGQIAFAICLRLGRVNLRGFGGLFGNGAGAGGSGHPIALARLRSGLDRCINQKSSLVA